MARLQLLRPHPHFTGISTTEAAPNTAPTNSLFGTISSTNGFPRYIHFGLKLTY